MSFDIQIVDVAPGPIGAVRARITHDQLGKAIISSLDQVYALLRGRKVAGLGHNVVVYTPGPLEVFQIEAGVQTPAPIEPEGEVIASQTPGGRAATTAYFGPYSELHTAHAAIQQWLAARGLKHDLNWELYGDWNEDPAQLRTDVFYRLREES
jgi:effector-binding domain-containing protein